MLFLKPNTLNYKDSVRIIVRKTQKRKYFGNAFVFTNNKHFHQTVGKTRRSFCQDFLVLFGKSELELRTGFVENTADCGEYFVAEGVFLVGVGQQFEGFSADGSEFLVV